MRLGSSGTERVLNCSVFIKEFRKESILFIRFRNLLFDGMKKFDAYRRETISTPERRGVTERLNHHVHSPSTEAARRLSFLRDLLRVLTFDSNISAASSRPVDMRSGMLLHSSFH